MKTTTNVLIIASLVFTVNLGHAQKNQLMALDNDGIANMVFANVAIDKGKEKSFELKTEFNNNEAVYARCYFPKQFGQYKARNDEKFVVDVWVNGRFVERKNMLHPDNDWDQIQVYLYNTGDDDFSRLNNQISSLDKGENTLMLTVGLERFMHKKDVVRDDGSIVKEDVYKLEVLSKGSITINVK